MWGKAEWVLMQEKESFWTDTDKGVTQLVCISFSLILMWLFWKREEGAVFYSAETLPNVAASATHISHTLKGWFVVNYCFFNIDRHKLFCDCSR